MMTSRKSENRKYEALRILEKREKALLDQAMLDKDLIGLEQIPALTARMRGVIERDIKNSPEDWQYCSEMLVELLCLSNGAPDWYAVLVEGMGHFDYKPGSYLELSVMLGLVEDLSDGVAFEIVRREECLITLARTDDEDAESIPYSIFLEVEALAGLVS
jgi:hypothetical protein